jgi:hypothetical protein
MLVSDNKRWSVFYYNNKHPPFLPLPFTVTCLRSQELFAKFTPRRSKHDKRVMQVQTCCSCSFIWFIIPSRRLPFLSSIHCSRRWWLLRNATSFTEFADSLQPTSGLCSRSWGRWIQFTPLQPVLLRHILELFPHQCLGLPSGHFLSGFTTKILHEFLTFTPENTNRKGSTMG